MPVNACERERLVIFHPEQPGQLGFCIYVAPLDERIDWNQAAVMQKGIAPYVAVEQGFALGVNGIESEFLRIGDVGRQKAPEQPSSGTQLSG